MKDFTRNIEEVPHLIVSWTEENLIMLKETLKSLNTKVRSSVSYLIFVMVFAQLFHMLARVMYWIFNRNVNSSESHQTEQSKQNHTYYRDERDTDKITFI